MSLDKAIAHGKERRRPYRGEKALDPSCRNHGGCPWCQGNRTHNYRKRLSVADEDIPETGRLENRNRKPMQWA